DLPARLTQCYRRVAQGGDAVPKAKPLSAPKKICRGCGKEIDRRSNDCRQCIPQLDRIEEIARMGRAAAHSIEAEAKRAVTQKINRKAVLDWDPADQPKWLTERFYKSKIQPTLALTPTSSIMQCLKVSVGYADQIRKGRLPHPRHWRALAEIAELIRK